MGIIRKDAYDIEAGTMPSAATMDLENAPGDLIDISGTTTITSVLLQSGHVRTVRFTGILTLTNSSTLVLPGSANITTAAGDFAIFRGYADGTVRLVSYSALAVGPATTSTGSGAVVRQTSPAITTPTVTGEVLAAGTATVAPLTYTSGTNLTSAAAGANEYDGANFYNTIDTSSGRGAVPVEQYFRLTAAGTTISTIANYFGATSNISLVASGFYEIDIYAYFLNTTSGTVVWTLTNSAAPTSQNIYYEMSPITGIVAPPGTATMLVGQIMNDATAAKALTATGNLTDAVNHFMHMKIWLQNGTGTNLKIQATKSAGSITPGVGSYWKCRRLPAASTGTFAA